MLCDREVDNSKIRTVSCKYWMTVSLIVKCSVYFLQILFVASVKFYNSGMYTLCSVAARAYFLLLPCNIDNQV